MAGAAAHERRQFVYLLITFAETLDTRLNEVARIAVRLRGLVISGRVFFELTIKPVAEPWWVAAMLERHLLCLQLRKRFGFQGGQSTS
jgi:hypothetical protein